MSSTITGTGISAVTTSGGATRTLHYQLLDGTVREKKLGTGPGTAALSASVVTVSPLASVTWTSGDTRVIHVYYLDDAHVLHDYHWSGTAWSQGEIHNMHIKANPEAGIAATAVSAENIRIYYQEEESLLIREVHRSKDHGWRRGHSRFGDALSGTNIAVVTDSHTQVHQIHLYYQTQDLSLIERVHNGKKWIEGTLKSGQVLARTPICASVVSSGKIYAFWRGRKSLVVFAHKATNQWAIKELPDSGAGYQLAMVQWGNAGVNISVYRQNSDGSVQEYKSEDSGTNWEEGEVVESAAA